MPLKKDTEQEVKAQLSLREQLLGQLPDTGKTSTKREISVMTRMSGELVEIIDALVELDFFSSRSESVSAFVAQAISARRGLFEEIRNQAIEIGKMRDTAKRQAFDVFQEESK